MFLLLDFRDVTHNKLIQNGFCRQRLSDYFEHFCKLMSEKKLEISKYAFICYGLGTFKSQIARSQLALAVLMRDHFKLRDPLIFDPAMDNVDIQVIENYGFSYIQENEVSFYLNNYSNYHNNNF